MRLLVDIPKPGYGTTNDGNTARRFFDNPELLSKITGLDQNLIKRFGIILKTINSGYEIKTKEFKEYCLSTVRRYVKLYN